MSDVPPSLVEFYQRHGISPVRQDISNLEAHFTRREGLYRHLGLLPAFLRGRTAIEIGPGSGFNSLYTATLEPSRYVLLEGNPRGIADIEALFAGFPVLRQRIEIVQGLLQEFTTADRFDFVLCEGMLALAGVPDPTVLLLAVARLTAPGGVLVITTIDALSDFAETLRRFLGQLLIDPRASLSAQAATLTPVFGPHLSTLKGMSRPHEDWVIDNLLNPASIGPYLSMADAIAALAPAGFELFGSSPRFATDWRWYKTLVPGETRYNDVALDQYWQHAHNLMDYRRLTPARAGGDNRTLYARCEAIRDRMREYELMRDRAIAAPIAADLEAVARDLSGFNPDAAAAVREVVAIISQPSIDPLRIAGAAALGPWFGRGQQYLSFSCRQTSNR